ncbi:glutaredoxin-like protein C5orf63 homolog isoform X4 [Rhinoderma darwinii]|uniref:glutaredoxin-like protein C5orf63 homolog isoform X4 n=1 Tax=Rhinoderma darwinii TaxID=43563 RepID=UPI003F66F6F4
MVTIVLIRSVGWGTLPLFSDVPFKTFTQNRTFSISSDKKALCTPEGEASAHSLYKDSKNIRQHTSIQLYCMNPCPLCDEAKEVLAPYMDRQENY